MAAVIQHDGVREADVQLVVYGVAISVGDDVRLADEVCDTASCGVIDPCSSGTGERQRQRSTLQIGAGSDYGAPEASAAADVQTGTVKRLRSGQTVVDAGTGGPAAERACLETAVLKDGAGWYCKRSNRCARQETDRVLQNAPMQIA